MKKLLFPAWSLLLLASLLTITSCKDDDGEMPIFPVPTLTATDASHPTGATIDVGDQATFNLTVTAPGGFKSLTLSRKVGDAGAEELLFDHTHSGTATTTYPYSFAYTAREEDAGQQLIFDFLATDNQNQTGTYQYIVNVNTVTNPDPDPDPDPNPASIVVEFNDVRVYSSAHNQLSYSWFSAISVDLYTSKQVMEESLWNDVDLGYFAGSATDATLAAPDDYPKADFGQADWERRNATRMKSTTLSQAEFAAISTPEQIEEIYANAGTEQSRLRNLPKDRVIVFKLDENREGASGSQYGILRTTDIVYNNVPGGDYLQFDLKVVFTYMEK
jgi:hypothetical protein